MIKQTEDFTQGVAPAWSNVKIVPRGVPRFRDANLRGSIRFAKRRGNFLPVIVADNSVRLARQAVQGSREIFLSHMLDTLEDLDNLISIGRVERQRVFDVDIDENKLVLEEPLIATHNEDEEVLLYAVPVSAIGPASRGDKLIQIRTGFPVLNGDRLSITTSPDLVRSGVEYVIQQTRFLGTSNLELNYEVDLKEGLPRNISSGERLDFRALPGYESGRIQLQKPEDFGPFLVDTLSGTIVPDFEVNETMTIQIFDGRGDPMPGYDNPVTVTKNTPIPNISINKQALLLWDVIKGSIQYNGERVLLICDQEGEFTLSTNMIPNLENESEWEIPIRSENNVLFRTKAEPNEYRDFPLSANTNTRPTIGVTNQDKDASRLEITVNGPPESIVEADNLQPTGSTVASLQYTIMSTAEGDHRWQSTSLVLKPLFLDLENAQPNQDPTRRDAGVIIF